MPRSYVLLERVSESAAFPMRRVLLLPEPLVSTRRQIDRLVRMWGCGLFAGAIDLQCTAKANRSPSVTRLLHSDAQHDAWPAWPARTGYCGVRGARRTTARSLAARARQAGPAGSYPASQSTFLRFLPSLRGGPSKVPGSPAHPLQPSTQSRASSRQTHWTLGKLLERERERTGWNA